MSTTDDDNEGARQRALGYIQLGMPADAAAELEELVSPDSTSLQLRVEILFLLKDWAAAAAICLPMTEVEPADPGWWIHGAYALRRSRSIEEAEMTLRAGLTRHPSNSLMLYNLACYACVQGRHDEARDCFRRAASTDPEQYFQMGARDSDLEPLHAWIAQLAEIHRGPQD